MAEQRSRVFPRAVMLESWIDSVMLRDLVESDGCRGELQDLLSILGGAG